MAKLDLKDAYYLVPVHESHRKFLRYQFNNSLYEFTCLPFGLNIAPFVFTKILKPVLAYLRKLGFQLVAYLDDIMFIAQSFSECQNYTKESVKLLSYSGFIINNDKSELFPSQRCLYL